MSFDRIEVKHQIIEATFDLLRLIAQSKPFNSTEDDVEDLLDVQMEVFEEWTDLPDKYMLQFEIWSEKRYERRHNDEND